MSYKEDEILEEARKRFRRGMDDAEKIREHFTANLKFISGDQWTNEAKSARLGKRPMLVINRLRTFASILINEQRQNQLGAKISPRGSGANDDTAEILAGMVRDIESVSEAEIAFDTAFKYAIEGNHGWWMIRKEYESEESFDYVLRYETVEDPLCIVADPSAKKADRSDMKWLFKFHEIPKDEFPRKYKGAKIVDFSDDHLKSAPDWIKDDCVIVAEYWRVVTKKRTLLEVLDMQTGETKRVFEDDGQKYTPEQIVNEREVDCRYVEQFILNGLEVIRGLGKADEKHFEYEWDGQWIPFVPCIGDERWIDGKRHIYSAISHSHDAQRMTNYYTTAEAEATGYAPLPRWVGGVGQFKTKADDWSNPHKQVAAMEYDVVDVNGQPLPPPEWKAFTPPTQEFLAGKMASIDDIKATMGMSDALTGMKETDQSGKAIQALQQQGNTANFNFFDNLIRSIRHSTRILIDLIPKVYDTEREVRTLGEDKSEKIVKVNQQLQSKDGVPEVDEKGQPKGYFLSEGQYGVAIQVGPSTQTQQQSDTADMSQVLEVTAKGAPQLTPVAVYFWAKSHDGPMWHEFADAIKPPNLEDDAEKPIPPEIQQQMQQAQQMVQALTEKVNEAHEIISTKQVENQAKVEIAKFQEETKRLIAKWNNETKARTSAVDNQLAAAQVHEELTSEENQQQIQHQHERDQAAQQRQHEADQQTQAQDAQANAQTQDQAFQAEQSQQAQEGATQ